jgi:hypothetical protein
MLPGTLVSLRLAEHADLPMLAAWFNDIEFHAELEPFEQSSLSETERESGVSAGRGHLTGSAGGSCCSAWQ